MLPPFRLRKSRQSTRAAAQAIAAQRVDPGDRLRRSSTGKAGSSYEISKSGQAPAKTPARLETGAGQWLNGQRALAEGQVPAGTMAEKVTGRSSDPSTNWLT